ncbi:MAG: TonB family protein [Porticoccaceae bacterium]|nr:TonB family protein [Porticoccaceae bacterium]
MKGKLPGYSAAIFCSLTLHGLLLAVVIIGWTPGKKEVQIRPRYIQATLLQVKPPKAPVTKKQVAKKPVKPKPVDNKQKELAAKKRTEAKKLEESKRLTRLRNEKKQKQKQKQELAKKERLRQEREKAAEALRRKQEQAFADALDEEEEYITAEQDDQLVGSYSAYIRDRIVNNWSRPPSARRGMEVVLSIQLVPTGRVIAVSVERSSGNDAFDRSAEQAVYKVERFEKLQELSEASPRVFEETFRHFKLIFTPDDLRL